jgi:glycine oxidase
MPVHHFDTIVIGQGLAGSAVLWECWWRGWTVGLIDQPLPQTASRVSAGLMTPITGRQLVKSWNWERIWPAAVHFYRRVERQLGESLLAVEAMWRLVGDPPQQRLCQARIDSGQFGGDAHWAPPETLWEPLADRGRVLELPRAGQLDVERYLAATRRFFSAHGAIDASGLELTEELRLTGTGAEVPRLGWTADRVIFCQGVANQANPWFGSLAMRPAKGEILEVELPEISMSRVIHNGHWLAPNPRGGYLLGATYDWDRHDTETTAAARQELLAGLASWLPTAVRVVGQRAAVRPIHINQYPVVGVHPVHRQLALINGLGSKGSVQAPWLAAHLLDHLSEAQPLDPQVDLRSKPAEAEWAGGWLTGGAAAAGEPAWGAQWDRLAHWPPMRLSELAHRFLAEYVRPGDGVVDATAGNGHDTAWLAARVGQLGRVWAIDIQPLALERTSSRLDELGLRGRVELQQGSHACLDRLLPHNLRGELAAAVFNLGYLPGTDHRLVTRPDSTLRALQQTLQWLRPGGVISLLVYRGHPEGPAEAEAVLAWLEQLDPAVYQRLCRAGPVQSRRPPPIWYGIVKSPSGQSPMSD